jgi:hypothetical protein
MGASTGGSSSGSLAEDDETSIIVVACIGSSVANEELDLLAENRRLTGLVWRLTNAHIATLLQTMAVPVVNRGMPIKIHPIVTLTQYSPVFPGPSPQFLG